MDTAATLRFAPRSSDLDERCTGRATDGAGDGDRTRGLNLGKVALCQLSYSRRGAA